jgi:hypothetical protein
LVDGRWLPKCMAAALHDFYIPPEFTPFLPGLQKLTFNAKAPLCGTQLLKIDENGAFHKILPSLQCFPTLRYAFCLLP